MRLFWVVALWAGSVFAQDVSLTRDEFKMYQQYRNALKDPRVQKIKPSQRVAAIAADGGFRTKDLKAAIEKGEAAGDLKEACARRISDALSGSVVKGRVHDVELDLSQPHAVVYVGWANEKIDEVEEEASTVAVLTAGACPIVSTIQVWASNGADKQSRVFQGLISQAAAANIKLDRVADFADTRFIRLFESVKDVRADVAPRQTSE